MQERSWPRSLAKSPTVSNRRLGDLVDSNLVVLFYLQSALH